jgi:hypothetical protein
MTTYCEATRKDGAACRVRPLPGSRFCFVHDPAQRARREAAYSKGGHNSATRIRVTKALPPELADVQRRLIGWLEAVEHGELVPSAAQALGSLCARLIELARFGVELRETQALEARLAQLEERLAAEGRS